MAYSFLGLAEEILKSASTPLTYQQIWQAAEDGGLTGKLKTKGKTPWQNPCPLFGRLNYRARK